MRSIVTRLSLVLALTLAATPVVAQAPPPAAKTPAPVMLAIKTAEGVAMSGNPAAGKTQWTKCQSCHTMEAGKHKTGPSLAGLIGRKAGTVAGFKYTDANKASGLVWNEQTLFEYLEKPRQKIAGTAMNFAGIKNPQQRADLIAWLKQNGGAGPAKP